MKSKKNELTESSQGDGVGLLVKARRDKEAGVSKKKKVLRCFECHEVGHMRRDCPLLKKGRSASASLAAHEDDSDSNSCELLAVSNEKSEEAWILDSASSYHVTSEKKWFSSYIFGEFGVVHLGDDVSYRVVRVGNVKFKMYDGNKVLL